MYMTVLISLYIRYQWAHHDNGQDFAIAIMADVHAILSERQKLLRGLNDLLAACVKHVEWVRNLESAVVGRKVRM